MNSKPLFLLAGMGIAGSLLGQGAGAGSGGAGAPGSSGTAAAPGTTPASPTANTAPAAATSSTANGRANGSATATGTPNMSPTLPSRSGLNTGTPPIPTRAEGPDTIGLPSGVSIVPTPEGVSSLSGIPISQIPTESRGTAPLGSKIAPPPPVEPATNATPKPAAGVGDPAGIAAHPQTNTQIGTPATIVVPTPPPAAQPETVPPTSTNELGQRWVNGHYSWAGGQWTWIDGTWQRPPQLNATWIPGHYDAQTKRWTEGHWERGAANATREPSQPSR